ncbi:MAG: PL29 family lyase N-terminal domain-containing protein [Candidatus Dojkabacteria bacterium]|mgnify:FL=1|jgi:hypothetical protein|nr:PL29 family lyase N-terminal domain-containing protein [Candidatus Dojkabacteria bacterium]HBC29957.1 hypothetical protein [Clostridiales bacterium]
MKSITYVFILFISILFIAFLYGCEIEGETEVVYPVTPEKKTEWLNRMNGDIESLKNIIVAIQEKDSVKRISIGDNTYKLEFVNTPPVEIILDNAAYTAPLIGAHKIDNNYYWTQVIGTGTSATTLLKGEDRSNYPINKEGVTPKLDITENGTWSITINNIVKDIFDPEGKKFRAIGVKSLFTSISFDTDSNATIVTNEYPQRIHVLPKYRPFTFRLLASTTDTLRIASGFSIPVEFLSSGISSFEFVLPRSWSADYTFTEDKKGGSIIITSPTGMEADYEEKGSVEIIAINQYGDKLHSKIPVRCEVGLVNYASVEFTDIAPGIALKAASFVFADESFTEERTITTIKADNKFRAMPPAGFPRFNKAIFTTEDNNTFTYYFPPTQTLAIGEQTISIAPPQLLSYWQGGIVITINETLPLSGVAAYQISGKVMSPEISPKAIPWFPNGNVNVTEAMSTTDGASNTTAIINALGGIGTSANYIARWAIRVRSGGYADWYLPVAEEYLAFYALFSQDKVVFNDLMESLGGKRFIYGQASGNHRNFWTSENMSNTQARMAVIEGSAAGTIAAGTKIYGCFGLAFRKFN